MTGPRVPRTGEDLQSVPFDVLGPRGARGNPEGPGGQAEVYGVGAPGAGLITAKNSTIAVPPPEVFPPPEALQLDQFGQVTLTGPGTSAAIPGTEFNIPANMVGVIREVTISINNLLITTDAFWQLQFYQAPVQGYDNMRVPPTGAAFVSSNRPPESTLIRIPDAAQIRVTFNIGALDANTYQVTAEYRGWYYPKSVWERYREAWR